MTIECAKQIHISHFLSILGHHPVKQGINDEWYISPLRKENTASFHVYRGGTRWHDFGAGCGGDIIDLAAKILNAATTREALARIEEIAPSEWKEIVLPRKEKTRTIALTKGHDCQIKIYELSFPLLTYSRLRGIGDRTITQVCKEIHYTVPSGRQFYGIGFQNDKGGWEIRSKIFKRCIGTKAPTSYLDLADTPTVIFEGFFDYLSALEMNWIQTTNFNTVVLNSVSELKNAISFFSSRQPIISCLDNDEAGRKATVELMNTCNVVENWSKRFADYKDLNDYLLGTRR